MGGKAGASGPGDDGTRGRIAGLAGVTGPVPAGNGAELDDGAAGDDGNRGRSGFAGGGGSLSGETGESPADVRGTDAGTEGEGLETGDRVDDGVFGAFAIIVRSRSRSTSASFASGGFWMVRSSASAADPGTPSSFLSSEKDVTVGTSSSDGSPTQPVYRSGRNVPSRATFGVFR
jgi:hypothetical protein